MEYDIIKYLGQKGLDRLNMFKELEAGWNFGKGEALQLKSLELFNNFINTIPDTFSVNTPSIFISLSGHIVIEWDSYFLHDPIMEYSIECHPYHYTLEFWEGQDKSEEFKFKDPIKLYNKILINSKFPLEFLFDMFHHTKSTIDEKCRWLNDLLEHWDCYYNINSLVKEFIYKKNTIWVNYYDTIGMSCTSLEGKSIFNGVNVNLDTSSLSFTGKR